MLAAGPLYVSWNYTYACNFNCSHCYSRAAAYPRELPTSGFREIARQIVDANTFKVGLGGGEPLIRKDCYEILGILGEGGVDTNVTTNGWFVDILRCERLLKVGLGTLYVSLDSPDAEIHDRFRRKPGSHAAVIRCLHVAHQVGLSVKLSSVITQINVTELRRFVALAEEMQLAGIEFKRFRASGNGVSNMHAYSLRGEQEQLLHAQIERFKHESGLDIALIYGAEAGPSGDSGCPCGSKSICIRPNGDVSPCAYGEAVIGNLTATTLTDLWRNSPELKLMREIGSCSALKVNRSPSNPYMAGELVVA
jgi:MoaA/NifB/PqqE/SkfB family radical SAM enzyme